MLVYVVRNVFYNLEKPTTFDAVNRILRDTGAGLFKTHKKGAVPGKPERTESVC